MFFIGLLLVMQVEGQKVFSDKKDPFTNERRIITDNSILTPVLQAVGMVSANDSTKIFYLSFITQAISGIKIETADSLKKECKLKNSEGQTITGKWFANAQVPIGYKLYNSYTYTFTEADFKIIASSKITDIKINQSLFDIAPKNVEKIPKLCGLLMSKVM
jgi:hypothetical protein